jgi:hypothetical protein
MATRMRSRRIDLLVEAKIEELADRGAAPSQIHRALARNPDLKLIDLPNLRTVQRIVRERLQTDDSGPWEVDAGKVAEAAVVIEVLATVVWVTGGRTRAITKLEATWVETITAVAPDLNPWARYRAARFYVARKARREPTLDLDTWLGLAPWRPGRRERYEKLVADGIVARSPTDTSTLGDSSAIVREVFGDARSLTRSEIAERLAGLNVDDPEVAFTVAELLPQMEGLLQQMEEKGNLS